jgi:SAM-dependent methyltransferase
MTDFDRYAANYDATLSDALAVSGESKEYFARGRITYLKECLDRLSGSVTSVLDFGCGIGSGTRLLAEIPNTVNVLGLDVSARSIEQARQANPDLRFMTLAEYVPASEFDLAFCNGVLHHIPQTERLSAVAVVLRSLRPGGRFAFWESNPWNPGTRYVMARLEFDRDAITLTARQACRLLRDGRFNIVQTDFLFVFPRLLRFLRRCEPRLSRWPLGAQYQVLCEKPR